MNTHLQSLNNSYVFAYIINYRPLQQLTDTGTMTIVDNSESTINLFPSEYGFFIDNIFIAGGYGFRTNEELRNTMSVISNFDNFKEELHNTLENLSSKKTLFSFKGTTISSINGEVQNQNILSPEYNTYNFITSYKYLKLTGENVEDSMDYRYTLSMNLQEDIRYIDDISISNNNQDEADSIEINANNSVNIDKFNIRLDILQNTSNNIIKYNSDIKLYLYSKIGENYKQQEIELTNTQNTTKYIEFEKPENSFTDDLILELRKPGENPGDENIIYSYSIPNLLKWEDKFVIFPTNDENIDEMYNVYNFRDTNTDLSDPECYNIYLTLISNNFVEEKYISLNNNDIIELEFSSNTPSYDYIIFRNNYSNIEFYFNGLQSKNWEVKRIQRADEHYFYIWQSPQKYVGHHTWKIKINL